MKGDDAGRHLEPELLAAYLDGGVDTDRAREVREHLFRCDECRMLAVDAAGALDAVRRGKRRWVVPTLAAAAVAGLLLVGIPLVEPSRDSPVLRGGDSTIAFPSTPGVEVVFPPTGGEVSSTPVMLTWRAIGTNAAYAVTIADRGGDPVWHSETRDTVVWVPAEVELTVDSTYLWYVDALSPDGSSASSGIQRFRVAGEPRDSP